MISRALQTCLALIVATKDRPIELRRLLDSLACQSRLADQVIIVDGGTLFAKGEIKRYKKLRILYQQCHPPSAAKQRNLGLTLIGKNISLIGFLDDDTILEKNCLRSMLDFWKNATPDVGGAAFNMVNSPPLYASKLKFLPLAKRLGLYSKKIGGVLASGFQTLLSTVTENTQVEWLGTCGSVWRKDIFKTYKFDEWFQGYSYLEDLDFSYQVGKKYKLYIVHNARYWHFPSKKGRGNAYSFGKREVANRLYFVKKHMELSKINCYLAILFRILISLSYVFKERKIVYLERIRGNIRALMYEFFGI